MIWKKYINHVSVSSLKKHEVNPVVWAWNYLEHKWPPMGPWQIMDMPSADFGKVMHKLIEGYYAGQSITEATLRIIPPYRNLSETTRLKMLDMLHSYIEANEEEDFEPDELEVEKKFHIEFDQKLPPIMGYIDIAIPRWHNSLPMIADHKCKKATYWKEKNAREDTQFLTYAWVVSDRDCNIRVNEFLPHNKKKVFKRVDVIATKEDINAHFFNWILPQTKAVIATINAYHEGGMALVYERYSTYDKTSQMYGTCCPFLEMSLKLDKFITWR